MDFKVLKFRNMEVYSSQYADGKPELFVKRVKDMEAKYDVSLPKIKHVLIGDSEYPLNEIHFVDGLVLIDEVASPTNAQKENKQKIEAWLTKSPF